MLTLEDVRMVLRKESIRLTPQRIVIMDVLVDITEHPTVERVREIALARHPSISLATVYNTVTLLARHGLIVLLHGGKDGLRVDPNTSPHGHAYCLRCGAVTDMSIKKPARLDEAMLDGFRKERTEVSVYGYCAKCVPFATEELV